MDDNVCANCGNKFASKASLGLHIKTKSCVKKRKDSNVSCEYCKKILSSKQMYNYHIETCVNKKIYDVRLECDTIINNIKSEYDLNLYKLQIKIIELSNLCEKCKHKKRINCTQCDDCQEYYNCENCENIKKNINLESYNNLI